MQWFALLLVAVLASRLAGSNAFVPSAAVPQAFSPLSVPTATSVTLKWLPPVWGGGEGRALAYELQARPISGVAGGASWFTVRKDVRGVAGSHRSWNDGKWEQGQVMYPHQSIHVERDLAEFVQASSRRRTYSGRREDFVQGHGPASEADATMPGSIEPTNRPAYLSPADGAGISAKHEGGSQYQWNIYGAERGSGSGSGGDAPGATIASNRLNEVQLVQTRLRAPAQFSSSPLSGVETSGFRLVFSARSGSILGSGADPETDAVTELIPYNADAAHMQRALQRLVNVATVQVRRQDLGRGQFAWRVTFDPQPDVGGGGSAMNRGDVPMLALYSETLACKNGAVAVDCRNHREGGNADGALVVISEERKGYDAALADSASRILGGGGAGAPACTRPGQVCSYDVHGLAPHTDYDFRLRALSRAAVGSMPPGAMAQAGWQWSDWVLLGGPLTPVRTMARLPPQAPSAPLLSSSTPVSLALRWRTPPPAPTQEGWEGTGKTHDRTARSLQFELQCRCDVPGPGCSLNDGMMGSDENAWVSLPLAYVAANGGDAGNGWHAGTVSGLGPATAYRCRLRAADANVNTTLATALLSPWGASSVALLTQPAAPAPPADGPRLVVSGPHSARIEWAAPTLTQADTYELPSAEAPARTIEYELQMREILTAALDGNGAQPERTTAWRTLRRRSDAAAGAGEAMLAAPRFDGVQTITTLVNPIARADGTKSYGTYNSGDTGQGRQQQRIVGGWFRLQLRGGFGGGHSHVGNLTADGEPGEAMVTPRLPYDASASILRAALQRLCSVATVQVRRTPSDSRGGFTWLVAFDPANTLDSSPISSTFENVAAEVPRIMLHSAELEGSVWSGGASLPAKDASTRVHVAWARLDGPPNLPAAAPGSDDESLIAATNAGTGAAGSPTDSRYFADVWPLPRATIVGLSPRRRYQWRVRARGIASEMSSGAQTGTPISELRDPNLRWLLDSDRSTATGPHVTFRLFGGTAAQGTLEASVDGGSWGPVCDDGFSAVSADAVCKLMGAGSATTFASGQLTSTVSMRQYALDDLVCTSAGSGNAPPTCTFRTFHDCSTTNKAVRVTCKNNVGSQGSPNGALKPSSQRVFGSWRDALQADNSSDVAGMRPVPSSAARGGLVAIWGEWSMPGPVATMPAVSQPIMAAPSSPYVNAVATPVPVGSATNTRTKSLASSENAAAAAAAAASGVTFVPGGCLVAGPIPPTKSPSCAANVDDADFVQGVGEGAMAAPVDGTAGGARSSGDGLVVLRLSSGVSRAGQGNERPPHVFYYSSTRDAQLFTVPPAGAFGMDSGANAAGSHAVTWVEIKAWGAGGGRGAASVADNNVYAAPGAAESDTRLRSGAALPLADGGGGSFASGRFAVSPGDVLEVRVGGGGTDHSGNGGGRGGFNGGGDGGTGVNHGGGGGGGASDVRLRHWRGRGGARAASSATLASSVLLVAAGGGGGGATSYCCAHGGEGAAAGSGIVGGNGELSENDYWLGANGASGYATRVAKNTSTLSAAAVTPATIAAAARLHPSLGGGTPLPDRNGRMEYGAAAAAHDARDYTGTVARHHHRDSVFVARRGADSASLLGGRGGGGEAAGVGGAAGINGDYNVVLKDQWRADGRVGAGRIRAPTPGRAGHGGNGGDGLEGGGGGGGGFGGGGGGGGGIDGAGGGGGSSWVNVTQLLAPTGFGADGDTGSHGINLHGSNFEVARFLRPLLERAAAQLRETRHGPAAPAPVALASDADPVVSTAMSAATAVAPGADVPQPWPARPAEVVSGAKLSPLPSGLGPARRVYEGASRTSTSLRVSWQIPPHTLQHEPISYELQLATGAHSDAFRTVTRTTTVGWQGVATNERASARSYRIVGLSPGTAYRIRVRAFSRRGFGPFSEPTLLYTLPAPANVWGGANDGDDGRGSGDGRDRSSTEDAIGQPVRPRVLRQPLNDGGARRGSDARGALQSGTKPSARRGHTMFSARGYVYMFGGVTAGADCSGGVAQGSAARPSRGTGGGAARRCNGLGHGSAAGVIGSDELWMLDPVTMAWQQMPKNGGVWPPAREQHTAVALPRDTTAWYDSPCSGGTDNACDTRKAPTSKTECEATDCSGGAAAGCSGANKCKWNTDLAMKQKEPVQRETADVHSALSKSDRRVYIFGGHRRDATFGGLCAPTTSATTPAARRACAKHRSQTACTAAGTDCNWQSSSETDRERNTDSDGSAADGTGSILNDLWELDLGATMERSIEARATNAISFSATIDVTGGTAIADATSVAAVLRSLSFSDSLTKALSLELSQFSSNIVIPKGFSVMLAPASSPKSAAANDRANTRHGLDNEHVVHVAGSAQVRFGVTIFGFSKAEWEQPKLAGGVAWIAADLTAWTNGLLKNDGLVFVALNKVIKADVLSITHDICAPGSTNCRIAAIQDDSRQALREGALQFFPAHVTDSRGECVAASMLWTRECAQLSTSTLCNADTKCRWNPNAGHEQCIVDMNIEVELEHDCLRQVSIELLGPGPSIGGHTGGSLRQFGGAIGSSRDADDRGVAFDFVLKMPTRDRIDAVNRLANHSSFDATVTELFRRELDHQNLGSSSVYVQWQTDASNIVSGLGYHEIVLPGWVHGFDSQTFQTAQHSALKEAVRKYILSDAPTTVALGADGACNAGAGVVHRTCTVNNVQDAWRPASDRTWSGTTGPANRNAGRGGNRAAESASGHADGTADIGRAHSVTLLRFGRDGTAGTGVCGGGLGVANVGGLVFDDEASTAVAEASATTRAPAPSPGVQTSAAVEAAARGRAASRSAFVRSGATFRPDESLSAFDGMPAAGTWTLRLHDREVDGLTGKLLRWRLKLETEPCSPSAMHRWVDLTAAVKQRNNGIVPLARHRHTAVGVDGYMYVAGGHSPLLGELDDMWRFHPNTLKWVQLRTLPGTATQPSLFNVNNQLGNPRDEAWKSHQRITPQGTGAAGVGVGRAAVVTPWRLLALGGYSQGGDVYDLTFDETGSAGTTGHDGGGGGTRTRARAGIGRMLQELWMLDPVTRQWSEVVVDGARSVDDGVAPGVHARETLAWWQSGGVGARATVAGRAAAAAAAAAANATDAARTVAAIAAAAAAASARARVHDTTNPPAPLRHNGRRPYGRYFSSAVLVGHDGSLTRERGVLRPALLLFGGDDGGRFMDDLWRLSLDAVVAGAGSSAHVGGGAGAGASTSPATADDRATEALRAERASLCGWRGLGVGPGEKLHNKAGTAGGTPPGSITAEGEQVDRYGWRSSCGAVDASAQYDAVGGKFSYCTLDDLLLRAWCAGEYQAVAGM